MCMLYIPTVYVNYKAQLPAVKCQKRWHFPIVLQTKSTAAHSNHSKKAIGKISEGLFHSSLSSLFSEEWSVHMHDQSKGNMIWIKRDQKGWNVCELHHYLTTFVIQFRKPIVTFSAYPTFQGHCRNKIQSFLDKYTEVDWCGKMFYVNERSK